jgi:hypothetical protein
MAAPIQSTLPDAIASLKYRLQLPGFELPETVRTYHRKFDECSAQMLDEMADVIEGKPPEVNITAKENAESLGRAVEDCCSPESQRLSAVRVNSFNTLVREIDHLTASLAKEIELEFRPLGTSSST